MGSMKKTGLSLCLVVLAACGGAARADIIVTASDNATVQPGGPRSGSNGKAFFNIEGPANGSFASFGVVDFQLTADSSVSDVSTLTLALTEANAAFTHAGSLQFFLTEDTTTDIQPGTSPLKYDATLPPEGIGSQLDPKTVLGTGTFNTTGNTGSGTVDTYSFAVPLTEVAYVLSQIHSGGILRFIITPITDDVAATWAGATFNTQSSRPQLTIGTTAVPEPASLALLAVGGLGAACFARRRAARAA